jgi:hypothetical protein
MHLASLYLLVDSPRIGFQHLGSALGRDHRRRRAARLAPEIDRLTCGAHHRQAMRFDSGNGFVFERHLSKPNASKLSIQLLESRLSPYGVELDISGSKKSLSDWLDFLKSSKTQLNARNAAHNLRF